METTPPTNELEELFVEQLRYSKIMHEEVAHYDRHPKGHADHTYTYMYNQVQAYIERSRKRSNRNAIKKALSGAGKGHPAAPGE